MAERQGFLGSLRRTYSTEIQRAFGSDPAILAGLPFAHDDPGSSRPGEFSDG
jgi:hypothetical protein